MQLEIGVIPEEGQMVANVVLAVNQQRQLLCPLCPTQAYP